MDDFMRLENYAFYHGFLHHCLWGNKGMSTNVTVKTTFWIKTDDIEVKRECIIKSLCVYLNEDPSSLILDFMDTDGASTQEAIQKAVVGIYVIRYEGADIEDSPADVGVVLEGEKVIQDLCSVPYATAMLLGLIYGLNLYPPELRYTFEVLQKLFLVLDGNKLSK